MRRTVGVVHEHICEELRGIEKRTSEHVQPEAIDKRTGESRHEDFCQPDDEIDYYEVFCHGRDGAPPAAGG